MCHFYKPPSPSDPFRVSTPQCLGRARRRLCHENTCTSKTMTRGRRRLCVNRHANTRWVSTGFKCRVGRCARSESCKAMCGSCGYRDSSDSANGHSSGVWTTNNRDSVEISGHKGYKTRSARSARNQGDADAVSNSPGSVSGLSTTSSVCTAGGRGSIGVGCGFAAFGNCLSRGGCTTFCCPSGAHFRTNSGSWPYGGILYACERNGDRQGTSSFLRTCQGSIARSSSRCLSCTRATEDAS